MFLGIAIYFMPMRKKLKNPVLYFPSQEIAMKAVEVVGEERIKKYYFGIEDESEG